VATISVGADPAQLPAGTYQATVDVSSTNGGTATLGVTFTVTPPPPRLLLSTDTLTFATLVGVNTAIQQARASNATGPFTDLGQLSVDPSSAPWLRVRFDGDIIDVWADVTGLGVDTYKGDLIINSARGGSATIRVTLYVSIIR
jgi:hypothetical protein